MVCFFYQDGNEQRGKSSKDLPLIVEKKEKLTAAVRLGCEQLG